VLLIDGDLRKPRVHSVFHLDNLSGLSTYLAGTTSDITTLLKSPAMNLSVIPSGPVPPNPSELLGSTRMKELMQILNERFDIILWDSPPLMTVTDGIILSRILDGTIIVVRAGKTTYDILMRGLSSLRGRRADDLGSRVLGVVINGFDIRNAEHYYYKYYNTYPSSHEEGEVKK
jgi:capsular exopolysaccharide synthesis family protein